MTATATQIATGLDEVRSRIERAAAGAGRDPAEIRLIAVSKYMPADSVAAAIAHGQYCFGENTVQDALTKHALMQDPRTEWHFIGHLQSNKARYIAGNFGWLHTLDSQSLAGRLAQRCLAGGSELNVLLQVNVANDPAKYGLQPGEVPGFTEKLLEQGLPGVHLRGLMTIGAAHAGAEQRRAEFRRLRYLADTCATRFGAVFFRELSMGMSGDFELAVAEGATMVRVGSAIFGTRGQAPGHPSAGA